MKRFSQWFSLLFLAGLISCNLAKYVPEGKYMLEEVKLEITDQGVNKNDLLPYIQQKANESKPGLWIYNLVDNDSSNWFKKGIRKLGEPPVIYNPSAVGQSVKQLSMEMKNKGYMNAEVEAKVDTADRRARVEYLVTNHDPYRIRNYKVEVSDPRIDSILNGGSRRGRLSPRGGNANRGGGANRSRLRPGTIFDMDRLEEERLRVSSRLRNRGYYLFTEDNLHYMADTNLRSNQVDLSLILRDTTNAVPYRIRKVKVFSGFDPLEREAYKVVDTLNYKGVEIFYDSIHFLRPSLIARNIAVQPGDLFRERSSMNTYNYFNSLNSVSRVSVQYNEVADADSALLDCDVYLTPGNIHSLQAGVEGTNKAGDLGIAAEVTYGHHNLFNGSELFSIRLRGAYEFVQNGSVGGDSLGHNFYEFTIQPSLTFPQVHLPFIGRWLEGTNASTQYNAGFTIQKWPQYTRDFFNLNWKLLWGNANRTINHSLSLIDINYVAMPWESDSFKVYLNTQVDSLTKYSYEDVFTAGIGYSFIYTNKESGRIGKPLYTLRFAAETSGNLLGWIFDATNANKSETGQYNILGNPFAQYVKADLDFAETLQLDQKNALAFHFGLGAAYPYKNSTILPFEKRYYTGGPNSVRGWSTRYLGPGSFSPGDSDDPSFHVGDINLITSLEYRYKWLKWLELAAFVDAGNIWTIRDYPNQPGGYFKPSTFYKEIAVGTGVGLRFDLSFLVFRIDAGTRVYDPALPEGSRFMFLQKNMMKNSAVYLAIGYPF